MGDDQTCVISAARTISCWGSNSSGQLGNGSTAGSGTPVTVAGIAGDATAIAIRGEHACALVAGHVLCWGDNAVGQRGDGTTTNSAVPVPVIGL